MADRLTPETKTLRYMVNGMGLTAGRAAARFGPRSFDLYGFVDVVGFKPRLGSTDTVLDELAAKLADAKARGGFVALSHDLAERLLEHSANGPARILHVQATTSDHQANRQRKILESATLRARAFALVASGHRVDVWGWLRNRRRAAEAFHCFELRGVSPAGLMWHDRGIVEVPKELLSQAR